MAQVLYISASSKPEELSTSKTVARYMINQYMQKHPSDTIEEVDLYESQIPMINYKLISGRASLATGEEFNSLNEEEKQQINRINLLSNQFISADKYIISAPMWSLFFPAILKQYLDCIIINGKLIDISTDKVKGLLDDKERKMIYIQSSGGIYPAIISWKLNQGAKYLEDIFGFLGIKTFKKVMIEGVDMNDIGKEQAIAEAKEDVDYLLKRF